MIEITSKRKIQFSTSL